MHVLQMALHGYTGMWWEWRYLASIMNKFGICWLRRQGEVS